MKRLEVLIYKPHFDYTANTNSKEKGPHMLGLAPQAASWGMLGCTPMNYVLGVPAYPETLDPVHFKLNDTGDNGLNDTGRFEMTVDTGNSQQVIANNNGCGASLMLLGVAIPVLAYVAARRASPFLGSLWDNRELLFKPSPANLFNARPKAIEHYRKMGLNVELLSIPEHEQPAWLGLVKTKLVDAINFYERFVVSKEDISFIGWIAKSPHNVYPLILDHLFDLFLIGDLVLLSKDEKTLLIKALLPKSEKFYEKFSVTRKTMLMDFISTQLGFFFDMPQLYPLVVNALHRNHNLEQMAKGYQETGYSDVKLLEARYANYDFIRQAWQCLVRYVGGNLTNEKAHLVSQFLAKVIKPLPVNPLGHDGIVTIENWCSTNSMLSSYVNRELNAWLRQVGGKV